jgi:hypothetical protein
MRRYMYYSQQADRPSKPREQSALHHAGSGMHERGTHQGWIRSRSYYVKATTHPKITGTAVGAAAALTALALRRFPARTIHRSLQRRR